MKDDKRTFLEKLTDVLGFIGSLLIAVAYVLWGLINLTKSGKTVIEILGDAAIIFGLSQAITLLLRIQGLTLGKKTEKFVNTSKLFGDTVIKCSPIMEYGEEFVINENKEALRSVRIQLLMRKGIKYEDHFTEDGEFKDNYFEIPEGATDIIIERINSKNKRLQEALDASVTMLQFNDLTSSDSKPNDPNYLGKTETEYLAKNTINGILLSGGSAIIFAYYTYKIIEEFSKEDLIYKGIQISFILGLGLIQLLLAIFNVTGPIRNRMINQITKLEKFYNLYHNKTEEALKLGFSKEGREDHGNNTGLPKVGNAEETATRGERSNEDGLREQSADHRPTGEPGITTSVHTE